MTDKDIIVKIATFAVGSAIGDIAYKRLNNRRIQRKLRRQTVIHNIRMYTAK